MPAEQRKESQRLDLAVQSPSFRFSQRQESSGKNDISGTANIRTATAIGAQNLDHQLEMSPQRIGPGGRCSPETEVSMVSQSSGPMNAATLDMHHQLESAGNHFSNSLRHLYVSASSIGATAASAAASGGVVTPNEVPPPYHNIPGTVPSYRGRNNGPPPAYEDVINPHASPPTYNSLFGQVREARKSSNGFLDLLKRLLIILLSTLSCTFLLGLLILIPFTMIVVGATHLDDCKIEHLPAFLIVGGLIWAAKNVIHCCIQCEQLVQQELLVHQIDLAATNSSVNSQPSLSTNTNALPHEAQDASTAGNYQPPVGHISISTIPIESRNQRTPEATSANGQQASDFSGAGQNNENERYSSECQLKCSICESLLNCMLFGWFIVGCVIVYRNYEPDFIDQSSARYCNRTVYMYSFWIITSACFTLCLFIACICLLMISSAIKSRREQDELV